MIFAEIELAHAVLIFVSLVVFGGGALWALKWAFQTGQMSNFARGATSIFDPDEPEGEVTDDLLARNRKDRPTPGNPDA